MSAMNVETTRNCGRKRLAHARAAGTKPGLDDVLPIPLGCRCGRQETRVGEVRPEQTEGLPASKSTTIEDTKMSDDPVQYPPEFNELYTLYLNERGEPVQKRLREMKAAEVLLAMTWMDEETKRLTKAT